MRSTATCGLDRTGRPAGDADLKHLRPGERLGVGEDELVGLSPTLDNVRVRGLGDLPDREMPPAVISD